MAQIVVENLVKAFRVPSETPGYGEPLQDSRIVQ